MGYAVQMRASTSDWFGHRTTPNLEDLMSVLYDPRFWNPKVRIAILALATYLAMC
jgi:hypothetical protein